MIQSPKNDRTRPTQARLRQALFNSIQLRISDARVLDLFAGSGALGFEALSRGASQVVFVEQAKPVVKLIEKNAQDLKVLAQVKILADSISKEGGGFWKRIVELGPFDIILADPPYDGGWEKVLLEQAPWNELLAENGIFCLEWGSLKSEIQELPDSIPPLLVKIREKHYGDSVLSTYERDSIENQSPETGDLSGLL